jgi:APA family basic amino acid/polyamine antiporter
MHPVGTIVFVTSAAYVVIGSVMSNPGNALRGALLLALGYPVFRYWNARRGTVVPT